MHTTHKTKSWELIEGRKSREQQDSQIVNSVRNLSVDSSQRRPTAAGKWKNVANCIEVSDRLRKNVIRKQPSLQEQEEKEGGRDRRSGSVPTDQGKSQQEVKEAYEKIFHKGEFQRFIKKINFAFNILMHLSFSELDPGKIIRLESAP